MLTPASVSIASLFVSFFFSFSLVIPKRKRFGGGGGGREETNQPFNSSVTPAMDPWEANRESTSTSPNSFLSSASPYLVGSCGKSFSKRVVFPEPRNPVRIVMGVGTAEGIIIFSPCLLSRGREEEEEEEGSGGGEDMKDGKV